MKIFQKLINSNEIALGHALALVGMALVFLGVDKPGEILVAFGLGVGADGHLSEGRPAVAFAYVVVFGLFFVAVFL